MCRLSNQLHTPSINNTLVGICTLLQYKFLLTSTCGSNNPPEYPSGCQIAYHVVKQEPFRIFSNPMISSLAGNSNDDTTLVAGGTCESKLLALRANFKTQPLTDVFIIIS